MQHQVQVIASTRVVGTLANPIAGMQTQYETSRREIAVYAYEAGIEYSDIAKLTNDATDQVTTALRNAVAQQIVQIVFDAAVAADAMPSDADPLSLFEPGHVLGMTAQISEVQVSYLPIYAAEIVFDTPPNESESAVVMDASVNAEPIAGFVPQEAEAT